MYLKEKNNLFCVNGDKQEFQEKKTSRPATFCNHFFQSNTILSYWNLLVTKVTNLIGKKEVFNFFNFFFVHCSLIIEMELSMKKKKTFESFYSHLLSLHKKKKTFCLVRKNCVFDFLWLHSEFWVTHYFLFWNKNREWCMMHQKLFLF